MLTNREVFLRDPTSNPIPNDGVAEVGVPRTSQQWDVLRWELASFVCEGEYLHGLERILSAYVAHINEPKQPAVWVSGFYGSGKSHLVRVLECLWRDLQFPDGVRARGVANLPDEIKVLLRELDTLGRRAGGLWSSAGKMGATAGNSVRLGILSLLLRGAQLPTQYPAARFVLWLKQEGYYDLVRRSVEQRGKPFDREIQNMYVSTVLAESLMDAIQGFATSQAAARDLLRAQYPKVDDIGDEDLVRTMEDVLELQSSTAGKLPCTLLVLDELQQFIGENAERALHVQEVVEACSAQFGSRLLFVGTGQSAIQGTTQLSKLQGRFTVRVTLSDRDIEAVVREVVLRKAQDRVPDLRAVLDRAGGEIDRQLAGTKIGPTLDDAEDLVPDYPLLPVRRRFWEGILRTVDAAGTAGQLRTQLRVVHDATKQTAVKPLGWVIAGDILFDQLKGDMLQSGALLRETNQTIEEQDDEKEQGRLRSRLCATVFLVGKLPTDGPSATGVRATADTLADLLIEDLTTGSGDLRQHIPGLLEQLVQTGKLMLVGDEYRLQTRESAEWERDFRARFARIRDDETRIANDRAEELRNAVNAALKGLTFVQGRSKTARKFQLHLGVDRPSTESGAVPVWVRDEWSVPERTVRQDAQEAGTESPIVFAFLPRRDSDALKAALASYAAAKETVDARSGRAQTPEAIEAKKAMEARRDIERGRLDALVATILDGVRVFQGGGNEIARDALRDSVQAAVEDALVRLFPKFGPADNAAWDRVFQRASQGAADALSAVGYTGDADKHSVCQEVRSFIGPAGKKGSDIRRQFTGRIWGWPQDAVDAILLVLVGGGYARASRNGIPVGVKEIQRTQLGTTDFYSEGITITTPQRIAVRGLIMAMGITFTQGEEAEAIPIALEKLEGLAEGAGGDSPLPERPSIASLINLKGLGGNGRFVAFYEQQEQPLKDFHAWSRLKEKAEERIPRWKALLRLLEYARELPVYGDVIPQVEAIRSQRSLLDGPDPVTPLSHKLAADLRKELLDVHRRLVDAHKRGMGELDASAEWQRVAENDRKRISAACGIDHVPSLQFSTDEELLSTLETGALADWKDKAEAIPTRVAKALEMAAKQLEPKAVRVAVPSATLKTVDEVEGYLSRLKGQIMPHVEAGNPVILSPWKGDADGASAS